MAEAPFVLPAAALSGSSAATPAAVRSASPADVADAVARAAKRVELVDTTQDGRPDTLAVDTVGDGIADTIIPLAKVKDEERPDLDADVERVARRAELVDTTGTPLDAPR